MLNCLFVGLGGFVGSVARYAIGLIPLGTSCGFPFKTLAVNILGAFAIGVVCGAVAKGLPIDPRLELFLRVGVCGGFTTFSTFAYETGNLLQGETWPLGAAYVVASVVLTVAAVFAGQAVGQAMAASAA